MANMQFANNSADPQNEASDFELWAAVIRSDQVPHDYVPRLLKANPEFARWYREQCHLIGVPPASAAAACPSPRSKHGDARRSDRRGVSVEANPRVLGSLCGVREGHT